MKLSQHIALLLGLSFVCIQPAISSISVGVSRVVFSEDNSSQSVDINNRSKTQPYLINVGISDSLSSKEASTNFIATPALFRVEPNSGNTVRILKKSSAMPKDRESVFYFRALAIPAGKAGGADAERKVGGSLQVATGNTIKIFYRPSNLPITQKEAMSKLQFVKSAQGVKISNPTPYYISLRNATVGGKQLELDVMKGTSMIAPFSSNTYSGPGLQGKAAWTAINDYGGTNTFHGTVN